MMGLKLASGRDQDRVVARGGGIRRSAAELYTCPRPYVVRPEQHQVWSTPRSISGGCIPTKGEAG